MKSDGFFKNISTSTFHYKLLLDLHITVHVLLNVLQERRKKKTSWCHTVKDRHVDKRQKSDKLQSSREIGVQDVMHSDEKLTVMSSPPCPPQQVNTFIVTAQICIIALTVYLTPQQQYKSEYPPNGSNNRFFFVLPNYESTT